LAGGVCIMMYNNVVQCVLKEEDMPMVYFKDGLVKKTYPKNNVKRE